MTKLTFDPTSRVAMQVNDNFLDCLELLSRSIQAAFDLHTPRVFQLEILTLDDFILELKRLIPQIGHLVRVAGGTDDDVGDLLKVGEDVHLSGSSERW